MPNFRQLFTGLDAKVPTVSGERLYINFDNAASTPPLASVTAAVNDFLPWYSSVHRGTGFKSRISTDAYEAAHATALQFVGANPAQHVAIFVSNTTDALNKLAKRLPLRKKDIVLISELEHHSNDLPWRARATVKRIGLTADGDIDQEDYLRLLNYYGGRIKVVAISGASNVTGHVPDLTWFAKQAHTVGAQFVVDAAQLAAHRAIRMGTLDNPEHIDYLVLSAHKMYAPFGTGVLIGRKEPFEQGEPDRRGGGTVDLVTKEWVDWAAAPDRDEAGSPNVVGAVALAEAMRTLQKIGFQAIAAHETQLVTYAMERLATVPGLRLYGNPDPIKRVGVVAFTIEGISHHLIAAVLANEYGVGVRNGCFCAHPYVFSLLGIDRQHIVRIRHDIQNNRRQRIPGLVRMSFGLYNTKEEIDTVIGALQACVEGRYKSYGRVLTDEVRPSFY